MTLYLIYCCEDVFWNRGNLIGRRLCKFQFILCSSFMPISKLVGTTNSDREAFVYLLYINILLCISFFQLCTCYQPVAAATFFPNFWKFLDPPFDFFLPGFIWFPELCFFPLLWILIFLSWGKLFPSFRRLDDLNIPLSSQSFWLWSLFILLCRWFCFSTIRVLLNIESGF